MKKLFTILSIVALAFTACEGDPGPEGPPGLDGTALVGSTYETPAIDFSVEEAEAIVVPALSSIN